MTLLIQKSSRLMILALMVVVMAMGAGCKSKKKAMEAQQAAEKARIEQEAAARKQREEEEARRRREADEQARRDAEARTRAEKEVVGPQKKLEQYFSAITNASSPGAANNSINEALALFASPSTPVLIVIHEEGGEKDYDRPTNIKDYLNYLKDQKKPADRIGNLQFDGSGKIKEVELVKQK